MKFLKVFFFVILTLIFACNNSDSVNTNSVDSTVNINESTEVNVDNSEPVDEPLVVETPNTQILAEAIPQTSSVFSVAGVDNDQLVYEFVRNLKANIGNKNTLSQMIEYPINSTVDDEKIQISSSDEFLENFDQIFNQNVVDAIQNQSYDDLFVNYQGVMVGDGVVWMSIIGDKIKIIAINN
ncbi:MAG: hypothetical protein JXR68_05020 [Bacteroidales bacterium]|nr:hypothetical protein [Bacteroidales bacterium]